MSSKPTVLKWWHKVILLLIVVVAFWEFHWPQVTLFDWIGLTFLLLCILFYNSIQSYLCSEEQK